MEAKRPADNSFFEVIQCAWIYPLDRIFAGDNIYLLYHVLSSIAIKNFLKAVEFHMKTRRYTIKLNSI